MSTCMEILNSKHSEINERANNSHSHSEQSLRGGGGGGGSVGQSKQRQKRLRKSSGNNSTSSIASAGILETLKSKFIGAENAVRYVALKQNDLEQGPRTSLAFDYDSDTQLARNKIVSNSGSSSSGSSSSEEDLFVTSSRRKQQPRRKMTRKGTYSMRDTFENSRQYYPATHHNILQTEQQQQQTIQQCNLHKGKQQQQQQQQQQQHVHFQQQQHYQYQHQHQHHQQHQHQQPQMRPEYGAQTPQQTTHHHSQHQQQHHHQQHHQHQQYQNLSGVWMAPKPTSTVMMMPTPITMTTRPTTPIITNKEIIDDFQQHEQQLQLQANNHLSYNHQPQQQQQQHHQTSSSNYCLKRLDSNTANGGLNNNTRLIEEEPNDMEAEDFVVGKTYITPPDIPSPPPQPLLSDNKRFVSHSGSHKSLTNTAASHAAASAASHAAASAATTAAVSTLTKTRCQCNKNLQSYANHTPLAQHHHTYCHLHHQPQQQQQQQQQTPASSLINQNHSHSHSHNHNHTQNNEDSSVILTKASSALKSQHYHNQQQQHQHQHQQHNTPHHHSQQQQQQQQQYHHQYHHRKMDVFAAAGIDDDDNDTSPSIKTSSHHQLLIGNCKHLTKHKEHIKSKNGLQFNHKPNAQIKRRMDYKTEELNRSNRDRDYRGLNSAENYNSPYDTDTDITTWPNHTTKHNSQRRNMTHRRQQEIKFNSINNIQAYKSHHNDHDDDDDDDDNGHGSGNLNGYGNSDGDGDGGDRNTANGLNGPPTILSNNLKYQQQHIIYNSESYETLHSKHSLVDDDASAAAFGVTSMDSNCGVGGDDTDDNMAKTALTSNKRLYKKFVLPLDIPTPPLPAHSYNLNKRPFSSHAQCQCDKQANFSQSHQNSSGSGGAGGGCGVIAGSNSIDSSIGNSNNNNSINSNNNNNNSNTAIKNRVNHISYIKTASTATTPPTIKENLQQKHQQQLLLLHHNKSSSSSSTTISATDHHPHHLHNHRSAATPSPLLQHHHFCQQKNLKLQQHQKLAYPNHNNANNNNNNKTNHYHHHQRQHQQYHHQHRQQPHHSHQRGGGSGSGSGGPRHHQQLDEHLLASQLSTSSSLFNVAAYGSQPFLPESMFDTNYPQYNRQHNSLTLSQRRMGPSFNRIADKSYMKNLVYSPEKLRRVRIILFGVGGIVLLALLATALYFIISASGSTDNSSNVSNANVIQLEDILQGKLVAHHFNGSWSSGSNVMYKEDNAIMEFNVVTKQKTRVLLDAQQQYNTFEKSADGNYLLLSKNYKKNFRHSFVADYDIFDYSSGQIKPLEIQKQVKSLLLVQWAPVGNGLIINYERNLYYKPTVFADEIALTHDTNPAILNGIPDWVYEEEVFASHSAAWFSPDGKKLAFIRFDDSPTQLMNFPVYGEAGDIRFQYPFNRVVPYPKAGSPNPRVKLFTSDLESAVAGSGDHLTEIPVPSALNTEGDYLITVVGWLNNTNVMSVWMNRIQNSAHIQIFNGLSRQRAYSLESKTGWVDFFAAPFKNRDGTRIALILPQAQSDGDEYRHLCIISTSSSSNKPEAITRGKYVVTAILHWDTKNDILFYTANSEKNPEQLHVYAIKAATGQTPKCLTCNLHTSNGIEQTYYTADFNMANQIIISSLGPSIPQTIIYEYTVGQKNDVSLKKLEVWDDNKSLITKLKNIAMPSVEIHSFNIADGFKAKVLLQLPPNMDRSGKTKYPMLVDVYGGPDSYSVVDRWMLDWGTYLSSNQSVIYAKIDGRGSGLRGEKLLHSVYLKLGTVEIADQIDVTRKLQEQFSFIDANHTGIWGWSYGGYAAAMALANDDKHVFRCAASVAPVTDWTYYDSIYTERYMGLPAINELGYASSRLSTKAEQLRGKKFLLVHGTLDDNVHYQQAMILAKNLERHDILFKQISYPDEDHSLAGVRPHLYHSLDRFFGDCFDQKRMLHSNK